MGGGPSRLTRQLFLYRLTLKETQAKMGEATIVSKPWSHLSDGVHITTRWPFRYRHHATTIEALTVRKYVGILTKLLDGGVSLCHPQSATA